MTRSNAPLVQSEAEKPSEMAGFYLMSLSIMLFKPMNYLIC